MPELPEVESARAAIEAAALDRVIAEVDDSDTYECRPHAPGQIRDALVGRRLTAARRRGKAMWCETSPLPGETTPGPDLGLHLGMSGRIMITAPDGTATEGGDPNPVTAEDFVPAAVPATVASQSGRYGADADAPTRKSAWDRFTLFFADGGRLRLFDKRRLGRVRLEPDLTGLGPDAYLISAAEFAERFGQGKAPLKARLLDQAVLAGVGNLLADETLWQAGFDPRRPANSLDADELACLHASLRRATQAAIDAGGVHTGELIAFRRREGACPRCGAPLQRATIGSRTTWWCPVEQR